MRVCGDEAVHFEIIAVAVVKEVHGFRVPARLAPQFLKHERLQQRSESIAIPMQRDGVDPELIATFMGG